MSHRSGLHAALAVTLLAGLPLPAGAPPAPEELRLHRELPRDPLFAAAFHLERLDQAFAGTLDYVVKFATADEQRKLVEGLARLDDALGMSVRDGLLAHLGPEVALAVDMPPIDLAVSEVEPGAVARAFVGGIGLVADVRDEAALIEAFGAALIHAGGRLSELDDGMQCARVPLAPPGQAGPAGWPLDSIELYFRLGAGRLVLGLSPGWVRRVGSAERDGDRLTDGADYERVFRQLDARPAGLTYVNLPRLREWVTGSMLVRAAVVAQPALNEFMQRFFTAELMGVGSGSTAVRREGGVRTQQFGPPLMSSGALAGGWVASTAIPHLLAATDRRRDSTLADLRAIGAACEAFLADAARYPGPTDGWVPVSQIAAYLEPVYIGELPRTDAWTHPILYWSDGNRFRLLSTGRDGKLDVGGAAPQAAAVDGTNDIVYENGRVRVGGLLD